MPTLKKPLDNKSFVNFGSLGYPSWNLHVIPFLGRALITFDQEILERCVLRPML